MDLERRPVPWINAAARGRCGTPMSRPHAGARPPVPIDSRGLSLYSGGNKYPLCRQHRHRSHRCGRGGSRASADRNLRYIIRYILRHDSSLPEAVEAYTGLTGRHELPPEWALGFQQCRYSYFPERRVLEVAETLRRQEIPADVIYLDIHYMDGYRVFTWDRRRFADPAGMIARLREQGFRLVTIVDPGVKADTEYPVFTEGCRGRSVS